ncbi:rhodanese-like domain-containing protein [Endothiovibrio diazotrophicus]
MERSAPAELRGLTPREAHELLHRDPHAVMIDIRSTMEFLFVGHPVGAVHIAWIDEPSWDVNPDFVTEVREALAGDEGRNRPIVLICRSGNRTLQAGAALIEAGFTNVHHVADGFEGELDDQHHRNTLNGWRCEGLPWEQC